MKKIFMFGIVLLFLLGVTSVNAVTVLMYNGTANANTIGDQSGDTRKSCQEFNNATELTINAVQLGLKVALSEADDYLLFNITQNDVNAAPLFTKQILRSDINTSTYNNFVDVSNASLTTGTGKNYLFCLSCVGCAVGGNKNFEFYNQQTSKFNGMNWRYFYTGSYTNITGTTGIIVHLGSTPYYPPSVSILSSMRNGTVTNSTNFNFYFNVTSVNNSNVYTCGVYENTTLKNSINEAITGNKNLSFSLLGNYERYFNFTINCFNENASSNISALYYVDNIKSVLNYAYPNGTYTNANPLYTNFSITDTNLYSFEWLVYSGITLKENITHTGNIGGTYNVYNLSGVSQIIGNYNWVLNVWENHNPLSSADLFKEFSVEKNNSDLTFKDLDNKKSYTITSKENLVVNTETKDLKQYFTYTQPKTKLEYYTYYIKYDGTLVYLKDSQYKGHFVLWDIKRYIDFQCKDFVKVYKENDNLYRIETPCLEFETTGNLNYMQFTGNFSIISPPSLSDEYLLSINETLTTQSNIINNSIINIYEVLKMLGVILIFLTTLTLGLKFANVWLLYFASSFGALIGFSFIRINDLLYNGYGLVMIIISVIIFVNVWNFQKEKRELDN